MPQTGLPAIRSNSAPDAVALRFARKSAAFTEATRSGGLRISDPRAPLKSTAPPEEPPPQAASRPAPSTAQHKRTKLRIVISSGYGGPRAGRWILVRCPGPIMAGFERAVFWH